MKCSGIDWRREEKRRSMKVVSVGKKEKEGRKRWVKMNEQSRMKVERREINAESNTLRVMEFSWRGTENAGV